MKCHHLPWYCDRSVFVERWLIWCLLVCVLLTKDIYDLKKKKNHSHLHWGMCYCITLLIMTRENNSSRKVWCVCSSGEWGPELADPPHPMRALTLLTGRYGRDETDFIFYEILAPTIGWLGQRLNRALLKSVPWSLEMCKCFESWKLLTSSLVPV